MHSVKQILKDNWKSYLKTHQPTNHQRREIAKMLDCSKNSCNSRICSSCGKRYTDAWSNNLEKRLYILPCRHVVLTVPSLLRPVLRNWRNLDILLKSSKDFLPFIDEILKKKVQYDVFSTINLIPTNNIGFYLISQQNIYDMSNK